MKQPLNNLDYVPKPPLRRRMMKLLPWITLALCVIAGLLYRHQIVVRASLLLAQRRCMTYVDNRSNVPVYDDELEHPRDRKLHDGPNGQYEEILWLPEWLKIQRENPDMRVYSKPYGFGDYRAGRIASPWLLLSGQLAITRPTMVEHRFVPTASDATVFLGMLRAPNGTPKLVAVNATYHSTLGDHAPSVAFWVDIITPAGLVSPTSHVQQLFRSNNYDYALLSVLEKGYKKIYPGMVRANDAGAFEAKVIVNPDTLPPTPPRQGLLVGKLIDAQTFKLYVEGLDDLAKPAATKPGM